MLDGASPRIVPVFRSAIALFASRTTITDTPEYPGAGPIIGRFDTTTSHLICGMAATANPASSRVAIEILESGGNAIDAAVAASFALGVTDPGNSGLGGTIYIMIRFADARTTAGVLCRTKGSMQKYMTR